jgi:DNA-directed RNA polymerase I subunit RPA12
MRRLGLDLLITPLDDTVGSKQGNQIQQRAVVNDECPKCKHPNLEYYTRQLRSADEGQTVFYECPNCHYKFSQNM